MLNTDTHTHKHIPKLEGEWQMRFSIFVGQPMNNKIKQNEAKAHMHTHIHLYTLSKLRMYLWFCLLAHTLAFIFPNSSTGCSFY